MFLGIICVKKCFTRSHANEVRLARRVVIDHDVESDGWSSNNTNNSIESDLRSESSYS
jgi:hypothetical protein